MKKIYTGILTVVFGIVFIFGSEPLIRAQESNDFEFTLEEISVTAQKREENLQDVALAMDVVTAADIKSFSKNNIDEILNSLSNAIIQKAPDGYRISIRGISDSSESFKGQSNAAPSVALNIDGVMSNRKDTGSGLYDLERVEILYGPQSTLYASNSPGGIVNVVTAMPKLDKFEAFGSIGYGNYSDMPINGTINVPVRDDLAIRAAFNMSKHDGYLDNGGDDEDTKSARIRALWQPNDDLYFVVTGEGAKDKGSGFGGGAAAFADQDDTDDPWTGATNDNQSYRDMSSNKFYGQMNWDTDWGTLSLVSSYSTREGTSRSIMIGPDVVIIEYMTWDAREKDIDLRLASPQDFPFKWILGGTYYKADDGQRIDSQDFIDTGEGTWGYRVMSEENKSFYGNMTYPVNDKFRMTVGYRKSWDDMISDNEENKLAMAPATGYEYENIHTVCSTDGSSDYKYGIEYDLGVDSMLYADYSTSYRLQGFGSTMVPEKLKAYTIGNKNRFLGDRLQLNWAAFYYDYKNYRASQTDRVIWVNDADNDLTSDRDEQARDQANTYGDGKMYGIDLSTSMYITNIDKLNFTASYMHSKWTKLFLDYDYTETLTLENGVLVTEYLYDVDYEGKSMMNSPPWTLNLTYSHIFNLWNSGSIEAAVTSRYQTSYSLSWRDADLPLSYQESHHIEDINAVYNHSSGKWSFSAYVNNVFEYAEKRSYIRIGDGMGSVELNNPRTFGCILSVNY